MLDALDREASDNGITIADNEALTIVVRCGCRERFGDVFSLELYMHRDSCVGLRPPLVGRMFHPKAGPDKPANA